MAGTYMTLTGCRRQRDMNSNQTGIMAYTEKIRSQMEASVEVKREALNDGGLLEGISRAAQACVDAYRRGKKVLFAGNGGSAADAQHLAGELVNRFCFDRPGLPAVALSTDTSVMTAIGNDYGFERLFARQVEALGNEGDVFIGISTSGNSANLVEALKACKERGITSISMTGSRPCRMDMADIALKVPSTDTPRIQECETLMGHIICAIVEEELFGEYRTGADKLPKEASGADAHAE